MSDLQAILQITGGEYDSTKVKVERLNEEMEERQAAERAQDAPGPPGNTSRFTGVSLGRNNKKGEPQWTAHFTFDKKQYYLGSYPRQDLAAAARAKFEGYVESRAACVRAVAESGANEAMRAALDNFDRKAAGLEPVPRQRSSSFLGVYKHGRRWEVKMTVRGKLEYIGSFDVAEDAARAYDAAALRVWGPNAELNFPGAVTKGEAAVPVPLGRKRPPPISTYKGVYKHGRRWEVKMTVRGKLEYIGSFDVAEDAARAYDAAALRVWGPNAELNFPGAVTEGEAAVPVPLGRKRPPPISTYKGVYKHGRRWEVKMTVRGKLEYIGSFDVAEDAARAYDAAALRVWGPNAELNFPGAVTKGEAAVPVPLGRKRPPPISTYKGVHKHRRRWEVRMKVGGKLEYFGSFDVAEDAARAYDAAALRVWGPNAELNFPGAVPEGEAAVPLIDAPEEGSAAVVAAAPPSSGDSSSSKEDGTNDGRVPERRRTAQEEADDLALLGPQTEEQGLANLERYQAGFIRPSRHSFV